MNSSAGDVEREDAVLIRRLQAMVNTPNVSFNYREDCDAVEQAAARIAALSAHLTRISGERDGSGWRPIETALKDGTRIEIWVNGPDLDQTNVELCCVRAHFGKVFDWGGPPRHSAWIVGVGELRPDYYPTHWRELPPPPTSEVK